MKAFWKNKVVDTLKSRTVFHPYYNVAGLWINNPCGFVKPYESKCCGRILHRQILHGTGMLVLLLFLQFFMPGAALATQGHIGIEGLYVHQIAHAFFIFSMVMFIYWIQKARLLDIRGWRFIRYFAFFFIIWNIDCMIVHALESHSYKADITLFDIHILPVSTTPWVNGIYYFMKMDHLFCVPAMVFLFLGLKCFFEENMS